MASRTDVFISIKFTKFYMKVIGFWHADNKRDQRILDAVLLYTIAAVIFAIAVLVVDFYHVWGDFDEITNNICITAPLIVIIIKTTLCLIHRDNLLYLMTFAGDNFWNAAYDKFGEDILIGCDKKGIMLICTLSCAVQGTVCSYLVKPLFANIGQNSTGRVLPFRLWVDLPTTVTPYYEITYAIQTLSTIHSAICFFCFDNLLGILNIHVVGQFKILQHRLLILCEEYMNGTKVEEEIMSTYNDWYWKDRTQAYFLNSSPTQIDNDATRMESQKRVILAENTYAELKNCIKQHQVLIDYVQKLDYAFNLLLLCQMGVSSIFMCLAGFKVFVDKYAMYILHLTSVFTQMLLFTWTGNEIIVHSLAVGDAAFCCNWYMLPYNKNGRSIREALLLVTIRAQRACYVSAGRITPISLQAFTSILSTGLSYLSVMRQMSETLQ